MFTRINRDEIAYAFLYETHMFDTPAEIAANPEHRLVKAAYRAADRLLTHRGNERCVMNKIERGARALHKSDAWSDMPWDELPSQHRDRLKQIARSTIAAMDGTVMENDPGPVELIIAGVKEIK